jgi:hypothetical protein
MEVSDQESVESSSSEEGSEGEGGGMAEGRAGLSEATSSTPTGSSGAIWGQDLEGAEDERFDGEMASAVASASHQATKFLEDSDSEEEEVEEPSRCSD